MPNGGTDNCGTCWFNVRHVGEARFDSNTVAGPTRCVIRNARIEYQLYTYCSNHPYHAREKVEQPVGHVYQDNFGSRKMLYPAPDGQETRSNLLAMLEKIGEQPRGRFPAGHTLDESVVIHLGFLEEKRAVSGLKRIINFEPTLVSVGNFPNKNQQIIGLALISLAAIEGDGALAEIGRFISYGLQFEGGAEMFKGLRKRCLNALEYCSGEKAVFCINVALRDPIEEVALLAREMKSNL